MGDVEAFQARLAKRVHNGRPITPGTGNKILNVLHGVFKRAKKVWALPLNPAAQLERHPSRSSGDIEVYAPEEVWALVRAAADERDASVYVTATFTGLWMGELRALRWRDVDFPRSVIRVRASYAEGELSVPKSGKVRSVPMVAEVAQQLAWLAERDEWTGDDDLVFAEPTATGSTTTSAWWVNGGIEEPVGTGPLWGARVRNRCALAVISLALDEADATGYWPRESRDREEHRGGLPALPSGIRSGSRTERLTRGLSDLATACGLAAVLPRGGAWC